MPVRAKKRGVTSDFTLHPENRFDLTFTTMSKWPVLGSKEGHKERLVFGANVCSKALHARVVGC